MSRHETPIYNTRSRAHRIGDIHPVEIEPPSESDATIKGPFGNRESTRIGAGISSGSEDNLDQSADSLEVNDISADTQLTKGQEAIEGMKEQLHQDQVIQLAIERAQKSTESSDNKGGTSSSDLQSLSSTVSSIVKEGTGGDNLGETKNKTGKISLWVIPPDEATTANSLEAPVSKSDEAVLNSLLSTPSSLENLSLSDQLLLADVLSSTTFPQTTAKKKKKKRPKTTTTTTTQSPFPVLQYLFGRNRGGGLFQRGLFRGGGLGGLAALQAGSAPQIQESPGGIFQNQNDEFPSEPLEIPAEPQQENPQEGTRLVNAAINVSRAVSQFMGFVIQGAAQSFQNYLSTRTRALADAFTYPPAPN